MGIFLWTALIMVVIVGWIILGSATSSTVRYYLKFTAFGLVSITSTTLSIPLMFRRPKDSRNALLPAFCLRFVMKLMGVRCNVRGKENIVEDGGCVVLINHQSVIDLIVLAELWPVMDRCTVISKKEIFYVWPFGLAAWLWGTIFIDRLNAESAQRSINSMSQIIRNRKARVLMFPEGTRSMKDKLLPFKKGAFHLAIASQCPVQPVVVSRYTFLGDKRFDSGVVDISILPPIETKDLVKEDIVELMTKTHAVMSEYLDSVSPSPNNNIAKSKFD